MLLDTSAWIELFEDTKNTEKVKKILLSETCYTSIVTVAEVVNWAEKEEKNSEAMIEGISKLSMIITLDNTIATLAGKLNYQRKKINKKWGMIDSFILATGLHYGLKILSKDSDFSDLSSVEILSK